MNQRRAIPAIAGTVVCGMIVSVLAAGAGTAQKPFTEWTDREKETFLLNTEVVERTENDQNVVGGSLMDALLSRRDLIVEHFDALIASRGEELVLGD
jgi:hypothetical protein